MTVFEGRDGLGRHVTNLSPETIREFALLATITSTINIMATALARIGFAVSLLRVAEGWPRRFTWAVIFASNVVSGLSGLFLWVQCTPIRKNWDNLNFGYCWAPRVRVAIPIMNTGEWPEILSYHMRLEMCAETFTSGGWVPECVYLPGRALPCAQKYRKAEGLGRGFGAHSSRNLVGSFSLCFNVRFQANQVTSAGIASWVKTSVMHILIGDDVTCEPFPVCRAKVMTVLCALKY